MMMLLSAPTLKSLSEFAYRIGGHLYVGGHVDERPTRAWAGPSQGLSGGRH